MWIKRKFVNIYWYVCTHSALFVRDAIFPHGIAKLASKLFESQKEVVENKERPLGEVKWAMRSTANAQKPGTKLGGAGHVNAQRRWGWT